MRNLLNLDDRGKDRWVYFLSVNNEVFRRIGERNIRSLVSDFWFRKHSMQKKAMDRISIREFRSCEVKEFRDRLRSGIGRRIAKDLERLWVYRLPEESMWVRGYSFCVRVGLWDIGLQVDKSYHSTSTKYPSKHYEFILDYNFIWRMRVVGGRLVFQHKKRRHIVKWFEQSRGYGVRVMDGYMYKGRLVEAASYAEAKRKINFLLDGGCMVGQDKDNRHKDGRYMDN